MLEEAGRDNFQCFNDKTQRGWKFTEALGVLSLQTAKQNSPSALEQRSVPSTRGIAGSREK